MAQSLGLQPPGMQSPEEMPLPAPPPSRSQPTPQQNTPQGAPENAPTNRPQGMPQNAPPWSAPPQNRPQEPPNQPPSARQEPLSRPPGARQEPPGRPPSARQEPVNQPPGAPFPAPPSAFPPPDAAMLQGLMQLMREAQHSDRKQEALVLALKPYLSPDRRDRLDRAMQLAKISRLAGTALKNYGTTR